MMDLKKITSEDPKEHWGFCRIQDRVVLDLGHGIWEENTKPTPLFFLEEGAQKVVGVDPSQPSYNWYSQNLKTSKFIQHNDFIDSPNKLKMYIQYYKPHLIKCDIEGSEIYFNNITKEDMECVKEIAVEYHNLACKIIMNRMAEEWGMEIVDTYQLMDINPDGMGVIHMKKPSQRIIKTRKDANNVGEL